MNAVSRTFDNIIATIEAMILTVLSRLGAYFCAAVPGSFTALSIYNILGKSDLAWYLGLIVAIAWESAGIIVTKQTIELWSRYEQSKSGKGKLAVMIILAIVYVVGVMAVVLATGEAFPNVIKAVGALSPVLAISVYLANALRLDFQKADVKQDAIEADDRQWQREKERLILEQKHQERLSKISVKNGVNDAGQGVKESVNEGVKYNALDNVNLHREERKRQLLDSLIDIYFDNPKVSISQVAGQLNISRQTVYNYQDELVEAGRLHKNGNGWEVIK